MGVAKWIISIQSVQNYTMCLRKKFTLKAFDVGEIAIGDDDNLLRIFESVSGSAAEAGCVTFSNLKLALNCNVTLKDCCLQFQGISSINGRGNCLTLSPTCTLIVKEASTLLLKNIKIQNVNNFNIRCLDSLSTISFKDVTLILDDDYTFTQGHFDILQELAVVGDGYTFAYQADQVSSILQDGSLLLDDGVTFRYDPQIATKTLIKLVDSTSQLMLRGATLHSTSTGLQLTKGRVLIDRKAFLSSEATVSAEGISFGDGLSASNNVDIQFFPAATLEVTQGHVIHNDA